MPSLVLGMGMFLCGCGKQAYPDIYKNIVSIKSGNSTGTGFMARIGTKVYLYTCLHCVTNRQTTFTDSNGTILEPGDFEICSGRDLVRFTMSADSHGLEIAKSEDIEVGAEVAAYGDSLGAGVVTETKGRVLALGKDLVEIDAGVQHGNSGGPVVDGCGRVVAVVSFGQLYKDIFTKDTRFDNVRRFGVRLTEGKWIECDFEQLKQELNYIMNANGFLAFCDKFEAAISIASETKPCLRFAEADERCDDIVRRRFNAAVNVMCKEYNYAVKQEIVSNNATKNIDRINEDVVQLEAACEDKSRDIATQTRRIEDISRSRPFNANAFDLNFIDSLKRSEEASKNLAEASRERMYNKLGYYYRERRQNMDLLIESWKEAYKSFLHSCCDVPEYECKAIVNSLKGIKCAYLRDDAERIVNIINTRFLVSIDERRSYLSSVRDNWLKSMYRIRARTKGARVGGLPARAQTNEKGGGSHSVNRKPAAETAPPPLLQPIPTNGTTRTFVSEQCDSMVRLCSKINRTCLVEIYRCSIQTNLAYDVFLHAGETLKMPLASGRYVFGYKVGTAWLGYELGFKDNEEFWFCNVHDFTPRKGCTLIIK